MADKPLFALPIDERLKYMAWKAEKLNRKAIAQAVQNDVFHELVETSGVRVLRKPNEDKQS